MKNLYLILLSLCLFIPACGGGGSSSSSNDAGLTGTWNGTFSTSYVGTTTVSFTIVQSGNAVTGNWYASNGARGTVSGTVTGNSLSFTIINTSNCSGTYTGTATLSDNTLTFQGTGTDCSGSGTFQGVVTKA